MHIDEETRTAIHRLWDEMAELPASAPEVCLNKLFTEISALIDSRHGLWLSSLRLADDADNDADNGDRHVLAVQVRLRAFLNSARDFLHFLVAA